MNPDYIVFVIPPGTVGPFSIKGCRALHPLDREEWNQMVDHVTQQAVLHGMPPAPVPEPAADDELDVQPDFVR